MFIPIPENNCKACLCLIFYFFVCISGIANSITCPSSLPSNIVDSENRVAAVLDPDTVFLELFIGQSEEVCLFTDNLSGPIQSAISICVPTNVFEDLLGIDYCVAYEGTALGAANSCFVACDANGNCDTTVVEVDVVPYNFPPGATNDTTNTSKGTPLIIDPLSNDTILGGVVDFGVISNPISGVVQVNLDGSLTYVPEENICARWDEVTYEVCNPIGCDTATVSVYIECVEITVFNAVSPNNDGINDYFFIAKIENFPNNRVWIYNRWGSLVFDSGSEGYDNKWPGTWGEETDLPDGAYFYILEWQEGGNRQVKRGYIELIR